MAIAITLETFQGSSKENPFSIASDFELSPRDYLRFAEEELDKSTSVSLINCVSHLKRALDCQLDIFFHVFNLRDLFKRRNLKIGKKLEFIGAIGYLNSRSLVRLNNIRNKMEHDYAIPDIQDIEVYFDLITALVHLLELGSFEASGSSFDFECENNFLSRFDITYKREVPEICIICTNDSEPSKRLYLSAKASHDISSFAYFFKILRVLNLLWDRQDCHEYVLRELELM